VRRSGIIQALTPDQCAEAVREQPIALTPLIARLDPAIGWSSLRLFAPEALPRMKTAVRSMPT
jgi:hypothetical protein